MVINWIVNIDLLSEADSTKYLLEQVKSRKKARKSVDRRASKGRKIRFGLNRFFVNNGNRYQVHEKLVGYCSSRPLQGWTSTNELFANLFGVHNTAYD